MKMEKPVTELYTSRENAQTITKVMGSLLNIAATAGRIGEGLQETET